MSIRTAVGYWIADLGVRLSGEQDPDGVIADLLVEIEDLRARNQDLEAGMSPFAEFGKVLCGCPRCTKGSLVVRTRKGQAILQHTDFIDANTILIGEKPDVKCTAL